MKRLIGLVVLLIGLLIALYLVLSYTHVRPLVGASSSSSVELRVQHRYDQGSSYTIDVQYPQFGMPTIDQQIASEAERAMSDIKTYPAEPSDSALPQNSLTGTFDNVYVGSEYVSVELLLSQYTGGAHGLTNFDGLSFDRATGRRLSLDDALKLTGLTLDQVSAQASSTLTTSMGEDFIFPEGTSPDPVNFASFVVSDKDVTFIFQPYQVGPYAAGPQEVAIPRVR